MHVNVRIPTALNDEQRELLERYAALDGEEPSEPRRFSDKLKDFFTAP